MTQQEFVIKKGVLTAYTGYDRTVVIPDGVQVIAPEAFAGNTWVTAVTIPRGVTTIGSTAFYGCTNLKTVTFGEDSQITSIGPQAFRECDNLISIEIQQMLLKLTSVHFTVAII